MKYGIMEEKDLSESHRTILKDGREWGQNWLEGFLLSLNNQEDRKADWLFQRGKQLDLGHCRVFLREKTLEPEIGVVDEGHQSQKHLAAEGERHSKVFILAPDGWA